MSAGERGYVFLARLRASRSARRRTRLAPPTMSSGACRYVPARDGPGRRARGRTGPFDAVVSVPLHRARLREGGFNQAALLGPRGRGPDKRTGIGYTTSRAEHPGSGRTVGRREARERRRHLFGRGPPAGQTATPRGRRPHHRRHAKRSRGHAPARRGRRSPRRQPLQDVLGRRQASGLGPQVARRGLPVCGHGPARAGVVSCGPGSTLQARVLHALHEA
jgi:hypothetical protein